MAITTTTTVSPPIHDAWIDTYRLPFKTPITEGVTRNNVSSISDLDHAVFKTPITTLADLWVARWGEGWVDARDVEKEDFYAWAALRLKKLGYVEEYYVVDKGITVMRATGK